MLHLFLILSLPVAVLATLALAAGVAVREMFRGRGEPRGGAIRPRPARTALEPVKTAASAAKAAAPAAEGKSVAV